MDSLPSGVLVLERGWLSANIIVLRGADEAAVVDSGYWTHSPMMLDLVAQAVGDLPVTKLANTHLHSDHCGGNAALQVRHPALRTWIPPGLADAVRAWDEVALSYQPTGQHCPRFKFDGTLAPGGEILLGASKWQVHGAPGHDPHSVVLFEPESRTLISADALWQNGFGIVFPELHGEPGFDEVEATLGHIERLAPRVVIPGHGPVFTDVVGAIGRARTRLSGYRADPARHALHAAKVLLKFKLLELQHVPLKDFTAWAKSVPYFLLVHDLWFAGQPLQEWLVTVIGELVRAGAAKSDTEFLANV
ncbi:MBL fold metallo-hydrolase [Ramlibacter alkalitolerans]|uniref:MBL fold metallo-hydrolase n=1 Tax=Ramlibacter alkalitolerans TaxID=2039631 RepID=A0ABS1JS89_9BURK|nr:MBL fold metallo-hydrolase [Ramlibacter alkalitolerans]MBL0426721.1 MBL fold metallo-hydrolase [Ramlibacter alkalitolerans]